MEVIRVDSINLGHDNAAASWHWLYGTLWATQPECAPSRFKPKRLRTVESRRTGGELLGVAREVSVRANNLVSTYTADEIARKKVLLVVIAARPFVRIIPRKIGVVEAVCDSARKIREYFREKYSHV